MGDDSSPTVNLIALSSAVRVRPRVGVGLENEYARQRCLLDQTIIEEARSPDIAEGNRDREVVAEEESHSTPPAAPKSSLVSEQSLTKHWNATNIETVSSFLSSWISLLDGLRFSCFGFFITYGTTLPTPTVVLYISSMSLLTDTALSLRRLC